MDVDDVLVVVSVAAGHRDRDRNAAVAQRLEHVAVARREAALGEGKAAEAVAFERIGAGEIDGEIGARGVERPRQCERQRREIRGVAGAVGEVDVEVRCRLAKREVAAAVQRQREGRRSSPRQRRGPVPLVDVQIDDEHALDQAFGLSARIETTLSLNTQ